MRNLIAGLGLAALGLVACAPNDSTVESAVADASAGPAVSLDNVIASPKQDVPSALEDRNNPAFPAPLIATDSLRSGGPPPDGIPAIDDPRFERAEAVDWLDPAESVLSFTEGGETRAYPIQVMVWHEIVNDAGGARAHTRNAPVQKEVSELAETSIRDRARVGFERRENRQDLPPPSKDS